MKVSVGVSNHHIHVTQEDLETLFGKDYHLEALKNIKQPHQFASKETVVLKTEKGMIKNVRILGPIRTYTQVEISRTDAYYLGISPPIRDSEDIKGSAPITVIGPVGTLELKEGCIIANRHIHLTSKQMDLYGLCGLNEVHVYIEGEKGGIMNHVHLKECKEAYFELHLDRDDANAFQLNNNDIVTILEGKNEV